MPPVTVHLPAGPATPDSPVFLDSAEPLVLATAFLPWQSYPAAGAVPARVSLPSWLMIRLWIKRSSLSSLPADLAVLAGVDVFEFGLTAAAWSRILTELVDSDLLNATFSDPSTLDVAVEGLTIANPALLVILAADLDRGESFDTPGAPGRAAVPARRAGGGRPAVRAIPAIAPAPPAPGPASLRFIHLCRLPRLEDPADRCPLLALALAAGAFGAISTRDSRTDEAATVNIAADVLRLNLYRFVAGGGDLSAAALAINLPKILVAAHRALGILRTSAYSEAAVVSDLADGLRYLLGGPEERRAIEARRSLHAADHVSCCPTRPSHSHLVFSPCARARPPAHSHPCRDLRQRLPEPEPEADRRDPRPRLISPCSRPAQPRPEAEAPRARARGRPAAT